LCAQLLNQHVQLRVCSPCSRSETHCFPNQDIQFHSFIFFFLRYININLRLKCMEKVKGRNFYLFPTFKYSAVLNVTLKYPLSSCFDENSEALWPVSSSVINVLFESVFSISPNNPNCRCYTPSNLNRGIEEYLLSPTFLTRSKANSYRNKCCHWACLNLCFYRTRCCKDN